MARTPATLVIPTLALAFTLTFAWLAASCFEPTIALAGVAATRVGGPCTYADFPGKAVIVAVTPQPKTPVTGGGIPTPYPGFDITYTFTPDTPIAGEPLYTPGRTHTLTLVNGMAPGSRFLQKYGITAGKVFPCRLRIIRQGTCTPVLYDFPGIDRADYFELKK
ncbi:conserved hypothetical protein [Solidesulfovibrio fructosivorans JJ]]|uniref:Lipoprotein n=1 Tax=Solidesulfovibrio fructosivorans JJ] TaxID=596151 RepID=E1JRP4_SOLFR|nr:hypothetical protein [Solidesulfovibrio fructosivorans]EFL53245.1 conserved hypothetical protein [Solidesulfovibrio fructosivorans JJ]]